MWSSYVAHDARPRRTAELDVTAFFAAVQCVPAASRRRHAILSAARRQVSMRGAIARRSPPPRRTTPCASRGRRQRDWGTRDEPRVGRGLKLLRCFEAHSERQGERHASVK